ncbi:MAG: alpha/beta hydrolase [Acidobacteria bacterium]|nr:alpha/beta hydrolase [Acidobacteriota bacterium]
MKRQPRGDGHAVLVLPGFLASSSSTGPLRSFLEGRGYNAQRWKLGRNWGFFEELGRAMNQRVRDLHELSGRKVSLIGWSLGGVYARELARDLPELVRQVITLGSPFRGRGGGNHATRLYAAIAGQHPKDVADELFETMAHPPPVPTMAIVSKSDGIVSWRTAIERLEHDRVENVGVHGSHCGLGVNPAAWIAIADRLAQPEGTWEPFEPKGYQRLLYSAIQSGSSPPVRGAEDQP